MTSPVRETKAHLHAAVLRNRKTEAARSGLIHLEPILGEDGPCGYTPDGNDACTLPAFHKGEHNIRTGEGDI